MPYPQAWETWSHSSQFLNAIISPFWGATEYKGKVFLPGLIDQSHPVLSDQQSWAEL